MANQFSTFVDAFNKPINQKDALKTITTYSTRVADEVFKDSKGHPDSTYPVSKMSKTIKLSLSGTLDSKYEPVGKKDFKFATIDPLYEKTTSNVSVEEKEYHEKVLAGGAVAFLNDEMETHVQTLSRFVNNAKNMSLTGIFESFYRTNEGVIVGKKEYDNSADIASVSQGTFGVDFSDANTTRMNVWTAMENVRIAYNISSGGLFANAKDIVTFCHPTQFAFLVNIADTRSSDNNISKINPSDIEILGYRFVNDAINYTTYAKNSSNEYVETAATVLTNKQIQMVDITGGNKFRYLKVLGTKGVKGDYFLKMVENEDESGWKVLFRSKPLPIVNGKSMIKIASDT